MKRILMSAVALGLSTFLLTGCIHDAYDSQASYFAGSVLVQYHQTPNRTEDDTLTITEYGTGSYHVSFTETPGKSGDPKEDLQRMRKDFDAVVTQAPRVRVVSQYRLPNFLRVTISHDGTSETHDFQ